MRSTRFLLLLAILIIAVPLRAGCYPKANPSLSSGRAQSGPNPTNQPTPAAYPVAVELVIWAPAFRQDHWRLDGPVQAAQQVTDFKLEVTPVHLDMLSADDYVEEMTRAAELGQAPDVAFVETRFLTDLASAGHLVPLDDCRTRYPEFDSIIDRLWPSVTWEGRAWGIPVEMGARPLFFSKLKLKALGWSEAQIAALPGQIERGEFTLDDLVATAQAATEKGVVKPGFGYWPSTLEGADFMHVYVAYGGRLYDPEQDKFVVVKDALAQGYAFQRRMVDAGIRLDNSPGPHRNSWANRLIYRDAVVHHRALFWNGSFKDWPVWALDYVDRLGGRDYLSNTVGYALRPSAFKGQPGNIAVDPAAYVITSERASGRGGQDAACALLAKTVTPEINARHAAESAMLGVLDSSASRAAYNQYRLTAETVHMQDHMWVSLYQNSTYGEVILNFVIRVENGEMSPAEAADATVKQLQRELGDALLVE